MRRYLTIPSKFEWLSFITMMPLIAVLWNYLLFGNRAFTDKEAWLFSYPVILCFGLCSWYLHIAVMHWLRIVFPGMRKAAIRLSLLGFAHVSLSSLSFIILFNAYHLTNFLGYELNEDNLMTALYFGLALTLVATSMWEAQYTFQQWKNSIAEKEKIEQLSFEQEFETLKSQVNPHFLFNCFNTLSSLISEDKDQALIFLDELSKVYRYLLKNNADGVSTLQTEIRFVHSYYKLLQTRHGSSVQLNLEIDKRYHDHLLPSLSLQLLIENAVKHNMLSKTQPLIIDIFTTTGDQLIVSNNLQLRTVKAPSNKIGLENIRNKYLLLKETGFQVLKDKRSFTVALPLIRNKRTERTTTKTIHFAYEDPDR